VQGFTLIELMIAVVIIGVLAALAYPTFLDAIRKGRRSEAFTALAAVQQSQERWRSNCPAYTTVLVNPSNPPSALCESPNGLRISATTPSGYYAIDVSNATTTGYTATATAMTNTSQADDGNCRLLGARLTPGGNLSYGSGASSIDWAAANPDAGRCWAR
jgi:type IV pilus assembly protein PilE